MKLRLSPRARLYSRRGALLFAFLGFFPYGVRAVGLASAYFTENLGESELGGTVFFVMMSLVAALLNAAVAEEVGALLGLGLALVIDRARGTPMSSPLELTHNLAPRTKRWGMWGAAILALLAILGSVYQMIWPIEGLRDPAVEALPIVPRIAAEAGELAMAIVVQGAIGWVLGAGASAILLRIASGRRAT